MRNNKSIKWLMTSAWILFMVASLTSCGQIITNAKQAFADDLSATILEFDDPETIRRGVPAYLILVSSMIKGDPDNPDLLESGARLYAAYASGFSDSDYSKQVLSKRAFRYASHAMCIRDSQFCDLSGVSYFEFEKRLASLDKAQAKSLLIFTSSWAGVIQANSSDWNAIAELPKVEAGIRRVIELDETVSNGDAHVYMAVMESLLPPALGGKPELAKEHFDRAIELSGGKNLMAKVLYAEKYARMMFDRELHDRLLKQVIEAEPKDDEQQLINTMAKQQARILLDDADDYF